MRKIRKSLRPEKKLYNDSRENSGELCVCSFAFGCVLGVLELGGGGHK